MGGYWGDRGAGLLMNETTVIAAFFIQPSNTLGGQAEELIDLASSERYENLLRTELNLPDAPVRLFPEGQWDMPSIESQQDLDNTEIFTQFVGHAAIALDRLQVADEVVKAFTEAQFEVLSLPTSGRVVLFQPITALRSKLGRLVEPKDSGDEDAQFDSSGGKTPDPELENYLEVLHGSQQAASAVLEGLELDPHDAGCVAILATVSARYLALYPGKAVVEMDRAWTAKVEEFMFTQCEQFNSGLHLTMEDPRSSIERLTVKLCFEAFNTNRLDADAANEIEFAIQTLEQESGATLASEINQLREKLQEDKDRFCFVATVVYGSTDAAEVERLREFRDCCLARFRLGRMFVRRYYDLGPSIASFVAHRRYLQTTIKVFLDVWLFLYGIQLRRVGSVTDALVAIDGSKFKAVNKRVRLLQTTME